MQYCHDYNINIHLSRVQRFLNFLVKRMLFKTRLDNFIFHYWLFCSLMRDHQTHTVPKIRIYNLPIVRFLITLKDFVYWLFCSLMRDHQTHAVPIYNLPIVRFLITLKDFVWSDWVRIFMQPIDGFQISYSVGCDADWRDILYLRTRHEVGFN